MQTGVSAIQATSQTRLNGNPRIVGVTRSHSGTEKQIAVNGIAPMASAPKAGGRGVERGMRATFQSGLWKGNGKFRFLKQEARNKAEAGAGGPKMRLETGPRAMRSRFFSGFRRC